MDEEIKKHLLEIIPEKINLLIERHKECGKQYGIFFESMQGVFADDFEKDPEATLEQYLKLNDKECAWEEGDFMTRDTLLDNFIGREIARELKREFDAMKDVEEGEAAETKTQLEEVLQENQRLKKEREAYLKRLSTAQKKYTTLEEEVKELKESPGKKDTAKEHDKAKREQENSLLKAQQKLKESGEYAEKLELYAKGLERRLQECLQKRDPLKLKRMASILDLGNEVGGFVPILMSERLNIKLPMVYEYLKELNEIGMVEKVSRGYYTVKEKPIKEELEGEIAKRLADRKGDEKG